jgi:hypothetical protein
MTQISKDLYDELVSADMQEAFELFVQQRAYFEVLNVTAGIVGRVDRWSDSLFYNASDYFDHDGKQYASVKYAHRITSEYHRFESHDEARAFAMTLLADIAHDV